jgi:hypothetical protein
MQKRVTPARGPFWFLKDAVNAHPQHEDGGSTRLSVPFIEASGFQTEGAMDVALQQSITFSSVRKRMHLSDRVVRD